MESQHFTRRVYFALFGLSALVAVGAFWWQLPGLVGRNGIAPAADYVTRLRQAGVGWLDVPTLAWVSASDLMLHALCALGCLSALALIAFRAVRPALVVLWASWLSLVQVCHPWLDFQWDLLLLEATFLSLFFAPAGWWRPRDAQPSPGARFIMATLACKVTLESGLVKVLGGDPSWRDLTALTWHWWTQPLPTWTSHLAYALPDEWQVALCGLMFVLELPLPLLAFGPRPARLIAAFGLMLLQGALLCAGNYSYYNLLTLVLAVPLLDDRVFRRPRQCEPARSRAHAVVAVVVLVGSVATFWQRWGGDLPRWVARVQSFDTINAYGAFAHMTKSRAEIQLEGTADGVTWVRYEFPWKPGALDRRPGFIAPWQPRLDWQMWFAALGTCANNPWVLSLQRQLLRGAPEVEALFEVDPFVASPPVAVRTLISEYRFAPWSQAGVWWTATGPAVDYCPPVTLGAGGQLERWSGVELQ